MNYGYMVIYKKYDGTLLYRANKNYPHYKKGDTTSMGWKVVDIQRLYNGKAYSMNEFDDLLKRKVKIKSALTIVNRLDYTTLFKLILIGVVLYIFFVKF